MLSVIFIHIAVLVWYKFRVLFEADRTVRLTAVSTASLLIVIVMTSPQSEECFPIVKLVVGFKVCDAGTVT
jgi:hypothetical protein